MRIVKRLDEIHRLIRRAKKRGRTIGFVPTMGALHEGHLSLIRRAARETQVVVVSLFVNPIQFDRPADLASYPRPLAQDARLAAGAGADLLFVPSAASMYPTDFQTTVEVTRLSKPLEGRSRPGHFRGVTTVVTKLLHLVEPDLAYFGQKDAQQARIVGQLIRDLNFPTRLRVLPTVREPGGLAMSSRNQHLSREDRRSSRILFAALQEARRLIKSGGRRGDIIARRMRGVIGREGRVRVDYCSVVDPTTWKAATRIRGSVLALVAAWVGKVRLIDNRFIRP